MQQYYKMEKKITGGAQFLLRRLAGTGKKSLELFRYLNENNLNVPIIGNVYLLSTITPAPKLMHDIKLPGCFVNDELLDRVYSERVDDHIERADHRGFHAFKKMMAILGTEKQKGCVYKLFNASEKALKYLMFDRQECGDCFLPENFGLCTVGGREKGMDNAPCGDSTVDGYCGNDLERLCIGELIYKAAAAQKGYLQRLRSTIKFCFGAYIFNSELFVW